jgi:hypothetical protein
MTETDRARLLEGLNAKLGIRITRIIKYSGDQGQYRLETSHGTVSLGGVEGLISQNKLRKFIADCTGKYIPAFKPEEWATIAQGLLDAVEVVSRGADATLNGTYSEWLRVYFNEQPPLKDLKEADQGRAPFIEGERLHIFAMSFQSWLQIRQNQQITRDRLTAELRAIGAEPSTQYLTVKGKRTSRSVWRLPPRFQPDEYRTPL